MGGHKFDSQAPLAAAAASKPEGACEVVLDSGLLALLVDGALPNQIVRSSQAGAMP